MYLDSILQYFFGLFRFLKRRKSLLPLPARKGESRNILILGSLGVGKSSLINMLAGRAVAPVSSGIDVVHPPIMEYPLSLNEISKSSRLNPGLILKFYDTVGMEHSPSLWDAIKAHLKRSGGVDVVVYCLRRGRLSPEQVAHLRAIWKTYCREDVPLLLVVSGADLRRRSTEKWWEANIEDLKNTVQVEFTDHVYLNSSGPDHPSWKNQDATYEETQRLVRDLVTRHCKSLHSGL